MVSVVNAPMKYESFIFNFRIVEKNSGTSFERYDTSAVHETSTVCRRP